MGYNLTKNASEIVFEHNFEKLKQKVANKTRNYCQSLGCRFMYSNRKINDTCGAFDVAQGYVCEFKCPERHKKVGKIVCQGGLTGWNDSQASCIPWCTEQYSPKAINIDVSSVINCTNRYENTVCNEVRCKKGFKYSGKVICRGGMIGWEEVDVACTEIKQNATVCLNKPEILNADNHSLEVCKGSIEKEYCDFNCIAGYTKKGDNPVCIEGVWESGNTSCVSSYTLTKMTITWLFMTTAALLNVV